MLLMVAELVNVASLFVMLIIMCFVIKIYLAVKAACVQRAFQIQGPEIEEEQRTFPVQALDCPEMEEEQRARHEEAEPPRRAVQRNRDNINCRADRNKARPQEHDEQLC